MDTFCLAEEGADVVVSFFREETTKPENLLAMAKQLPPNAHWSVLGVGRTQLPTITMGILLGAHIRVGFEHNVCLRRGVLLKDNAEMVEVAVNLVEQLQRKVATTDDARQMLGLSNGASAT